MPRRRVREVDAASSSDRNGEPILVPIAITSVNKAATEHTESVVGSLNSAIISRTSTPHPQPGLMKRIFPGNLTTRSFWLRFQILELLSSSQPVPPWGPAPKPPRFSKHSAGVRKFFCPGYRKPCPASSGFHAREAILLSIARRGEIFRTPAPCFQKPRGLGQSPKVANLSPKRGEGSGDIKRGAPRLKNTEVISGQFSSLLSHS